MSEIKVNSIKGVGASTAAITVNNTDGTCTANITNNLSNRNLIINGAMQVAQRGTSASATGYQTVDRFEGSFGATDETPTQSQVDVASGTTPYTLGFRKAFRLTNGNQTGGAGSSDYVGYIYHVEAQDIANSGWNYTDPNSFITLSFWVKSSVAQAFSGSMRTVDGSVYHYKYDTPTLSADTWTKVTKVIPGNSNIQIDSNNDKGFTFSLFGFIGTNFTSSNSDTETWLAYSIDKFANVVTSTWYTTNDATLEITGVQLEVGSVATDFEHRSFGQELALCQRYYQTGFIKVYDSNAGVQAVSQNFMPEMRAAPTITGEQFESQTDAIWSSVEVTTSRACSFYKNAIEICQRWKCDAEL